MPEITKNARVVANFLDDLVRALRGDKSFQKRLKVAELKREGHSRVADRWFEKTTGYRTRFCSITVTVSAETRDVRLDGRIVGEDVLSGRMPGAVMDRYTLLRGDIAERYVFQEADRADKLREIKKLAKEGMQALEYGDIAGKIRRTRPAVIRCGRKRRNRSKK